MDWCGFLIDEDGYLVCCFCDKRFNSKQEILLHVGSVHQAGGDDGNLLHYFKDRDHLRKFCLKEGIRYSMADQLFSLKTGNDSNTTFSPASFYTNQAATYLSTRRFDALDCPYRWNRLNLPMSLVVEGGTYEVQKGSNLNFLCMGG